MEMEMENLNIHHRRPHSSIKRHLNQKTKKRSIPRLSRNKSKRHREINKRRVAHDLQNEFIIKFKEFLMYNIEDNKNIYGDIELLKALAENEYDNNKKKGKEDYNKKVDDFLEGFTLKFDITIDDIFKEQIYTKLLGNYDEQIETRKEEYNKYIQNEIKRQEKLNELLEYLIDNNDIIDLRKAHEELKKIVQHRQQETEYSIQQQQERTHNILKLEEELEIFLKKNVEQLTQEQQSNVNMYIDAFMSDPQPEQELLKNYKIIDFDKSKDRKKIEEDDIISNPDDFKCDDGNKDCKNIFDLEQYMDISIDEFKQDEYKEYIIFYHTKSIPYILSRKQIISELENRENLYYECQGFKPENESGSFILRADENVKNPPYYKLPSNSTYYIKLKEIFKILKSTHREWLIFDDNKKLKRIGSRVNTAFSQNNDGFLINYEGNIINVVSGNHCQKEPSPINTHTLIPVNINDVGDAPVKYTTKGGRKNKQNKSIKGGRKNWTQKTTKR